MENMKNKEELEKERDLLLEEMKGLGVKDPETGRWQPVPFAQEYGEADESDMADRAEDFESRASVLAVLEERLNDVEEKLKTM